MKYLPFLHVGMVPAGSPNNIYMMLQFIAPQKLSVQFFDTKKNEKNKAANSHQKITTKIFHAFNWKFADVQRKASSSLNGC